MHPTNLDFSCDQPLLQSDMQQKRKAEFCKHYFGALSPWSEPHVERVLSASHPKSIADEENSSFTQFVASTYYGNNSRNNPIPYSQGWLDSIKANSNLV